MDPHRAGKITAVDHTSGGKSIVLYMTAFIVAVIALIIVPLLALTANQMTRIKQVVYKYCSLHTHHLDDLTPTVVKKEVTPRMDSFHYLSLLVMFCLSLPQ